MKNSTLFTFLSLTLIAVLSCSNFRPDQKDTTHYYLIRHAEKAVDGTDDPDLSFEGQERAQKLAAMLKDKKIEKLYATDFKRTQQTLQPLAKALNLQIETYDAHVPASVARMLSDCKGKTVVITGHSNTIPGLANTIIGKEKYKEMEEDDYSRMWEIVLTGDRVSGDKVITY
jgi:2,3-bisphosphoglycerate-dependent phosphoglycerate mutase